MQGVSPILPRVLKKKGPADTHIYVYLYKFNNIFLKNQGAPPVALFNTVFISAFRGMQIPAKRHVLPEY